ncbi:MAG: FHA domain-containing protein [Planctomycetes bacterium]|nr:FHA domain-containing protein [Planctomycetota bacterium]MCB9917324.1 FHA domain-containing protein [Planctomycetota bacterium]
MENELEATDIGDEPTRGRQWQLVLTTCGGASSPQRIAFAKSEVLIGRRSDCDFVVDSDAGFLVSGLHARLRADGDTWSLEDLGSRNGSFVDGKPVEGRACLVPGSIVSLGNPDDDGSLQLRAEFEGSSRSVAHPDKTSGDAKQADGLFGMLARKVRSVKDRRDLKRRVAELEPTVELLADELRRRNADLGRIAWTRHAESCEAYDAASGLRRESDFMDEALARIEEAEAADREDQIAFDEWCEAWSRDHAVVEEAHERACREAHESAEALQAADRELRTADCAVHEFAEGTCNAALAWVEQHSDGIGEGYLEARKALHGRIVALAEALAKPPEGFDELLERRADRRERDASCRESVLQARARLDGLVNEKEQRDASLREQLALSERRRGEALATRSEHMRRLEAVFPDLGREIVRGPRGFAFRLVEFEAARAAQELWRDRYTELEALRAALERLQAD